MAEENVQKKPGTSTFSIEKVPNETKHTILVMSGKGGVGKSTVASNLAFFLSQQGHKTGIMDLDFHGPNIPKMFGLEGKKATVDDSGIEPLPVNDNLSMMSMSLVLPDSDTPVIWRGPVKMNAVRQFIKDVRWGKLDYLVVDLPPGTGDEPLSIIQLMPKIDGTVIVTTPQEVAAMDCRKSVLFSRKVNTRVLGVIENMSGFICPHCKKEVKIFEGTGGKSISEDLDVPYLGKIPLDPRISRLSDSGKIGSVKEHSDLEKNYLDIIGKLMDQLSE